MNTFFVTAILALCAVSVHCDYDKRYKHYGSSDPWWWYRKNYGHYSYRNPLLGVGSAFNGLSYYDYDDGRFGNNALSFLNSNNGLFFGNNGFNNAGSYYKGLFGRRPYHYNTRTYYPLFNNGGLNNLFNNYFGDDDYSSYYRYLRPSSYSYSRYYPSSTYYYPRYYPSSRYYYPRYYPSSRYYFPASRRLYPSGLLGRRSYRKKVY